MNPMEWIDARCEVPRTPKTNGDRIRGMSDGELAEFLSSLEVLDMCTERRVCVEAIDADRDIPAEWCIRCTLRWLQSTVKGDEPT